MDKNLFFCLMFIVLRFRSLVDYLTSFSGVDLSLNSRCSLFPLPSWQVNVHIVVFSGRHVCTNWTATIESYFYIHFCTLRVVMCIFYIFIYLHHKLKKGPVTFSSVRLEAGVTWNTVRCCCYIFLMHFREREFYMEETLFHGNSDVSFVHDRSFVLCAHMDGEVNGLIIWLFHVVIKFGWLKLFFPPISLSVFSVFGVNVHVFCVVSTQIHDWFAVVCCFIKMN